MSCISAISLKIEIKISVAKKLASTNFGAKLPVKISVAKKLASTNFGAKLLVKMDMNKCVEILGADIDTCDTKNQSPFFGLTSLKLLSESVNLLEESDTNMSEQMNMLTTDSQDTEIGDADQKQIEKENTMMFSSF